MNPTRKEGMLRTSRRMRRELKRIAHCLPHHPHFREALLDMLHARFSARDGKERVNVRCHFALILYRYIREEMKAEGLTPRRLPGTQRLFWTQIPVLTELVMDAQYKFNHVLDGKFGVSRESILQHPSINQQMLLADEMQDLCYRYIEQCVLVDAPDEQAKVLAAVKQMLRATRHGQWLEKEYATYDNLLRGFDDPPYATTDTDKLIDKDIIDHLWSAFEQAGVRADFESFSRFYLRRICLTSAMIYVATAALIMDLLGYHGAQRSHILRFCAEFGIILQLRNDLDDYLPADLISERVAKLPEDAFADLRNHNITLPFMLYASHHPVDYAVLQRDLHQLKRQHEVFEEVRGVCVERIFPMLARLARRCRMELRKANAWQTVLTDFTSITRYNKKKFRDYNPPITVRDPEEE